MTDNTQIVKIGRVVSVYDPNDCGRIKVNIKCFEDDTRLYEANSDYTSDKFIDSLPWAFPLLPKYLHINPKVNDYVLVFNIEAGDNNNQRFFIGPIMPQLINLNGTGGLHSLSALEGSVVGLPKALGVETNGAKPNHDDISIVGRKNCDITITENDVKITSGVRLFSGSGFKLNEYGNHGIIKLKYHEKELEDPQHEDSFRSSATIIADKINLIGGNPNTYCLFSDSDGVNADTYKKDLLPDGELIAAMSDLHDLPYGDKLIEFLNLFLKSYTNHTHKFFGAHYYPVENDSYLKLISYPMDEILSKNVKIN